MRRLLSLLLLAVALTAPVLAQGPDRSRPPEAGAPPALKMPPIVKRKLSNGIPVWFVERHEVPLATVVLLLRSGATQDPSGKWGLASFTASMLEEGAGKRSSLEFADAVDMLAADLGTAVGFDSTTVDLNVPVKNLAPALDLMADLVLAPTFPQAELQRQKTQGLTAFLQARSDPDYLNGTAFGARLYPAGHRYGMSTTGSAAQFATFTRQDLVAFHQGAWRPDRASFVVTGDVQPDAVMKLLEKRFGRWKPAGKALPVAPVPKAPPATATGVFVVDRPGSPQSVVRIGSVGVPRSTPDYFPLQVVNTVLGGSFTSRLNQNLRERNGYTYGASSRFAMRLGAGPFSVSTNVQTDKTGAAVREILNELAAIRQPISAAELEKARNYVAYGFPGDFETSDDLASRLAEMQLYGLADTYYSTYVPSLLAVDPTAAAKAAAAHIVPERMLIVIVGDAQALRPQLEGLGLGPVQTLTVEDVLGPAVR